MIGNRNVWHDGLPGSWSIVPFGYLFDIQQGKALNQRAREGEPQCRFLRTSNVLWGELELSSVDTMEFTHAEQSKFALRPGDLLVCEGGDIGRTAMWSGAIEDCYYQNHLHRCRAKTSDVDPEFFMFWMRFAVKSQNMYAGHGNVTTIANLSKSRLAAFTVPHPPLSEQRAIAHVLRTVQQAKEATEQVNTAAQELKLGFICKYVAREDLPETWTRRPIGELASRVEYGISKRGGRSGAYPILRMNSIADGQVETDDLQWVDLTPEEFERFRLERGDVLFNRTNSIDKVGKSALFDLDGDWVFASYLLRVVVEPDLLDPRFLNYVLGAPATKATLRGLAVRAVSQANINATKLKDLLVPVPPISDQRRIAEIVQTVDQKIAAEEARRDALAILFDSLLHDLMTARLQVTDLKVPA